MTVRIEREASTTIVTIDRPFSRNAVDPATAEQLFQAFVAFDADDSQSVAVLTGAGGAFSAGFDLKASADVKETWFAEHALDGSFDDRDDRPRKGPMGPTRLTLSKPVIAAIAGPAVAGGMELALWCDFRVMQEDAYFGVYCRRWGVPLIDGGTVRLPRLIGMGHAMDLILTGRQVGAEEALRIGLANRVVPTGQSRDAALALARELAAFPQATMRADRESAYAQWDLPLGEALHQEWQRGRARIPDALQGAARFAGGEGRHGRF